MVSLLIAVTTSFSSCLFFFAADPEVRFQNATADFQFHYGLRVDHTDYLFSSNDPFVPGDSTEYKPLDAGTHSIQAKTVNGNWITSSNGSFNFEANTTYTVSIGGNSAALNFSLIVD
jgi:hypothetical protein